MVTLLSCRVHMNSRLVAVFLVSALAISGCSKLSEQGTATGGNNNRSVVGTKALAHAAEVARSSGDLIPANPDMVRLMKLPVTNKDGTYSCWQLIIKPANDDVRAIYVGAKDTDNIILGRVNTRREAFERYSYLTSPGGELRCVVYSYWGSLDQQIIERNDPRYQRAATDFEEQVAFWRNVEGKARAKLSKKVGTHIRCVAIHLSTRRSSFAPGITAHPEDPVDLTDRRYRTWVEWPCFGTTLG